MVDLPVRVEGKMTPKCMEVLKVACAEVFGHGEKVNFVPSKNGVLLSEDRLSTYPFPEWYLVQAVLRQIGRLPTEALAERTLYFDTETHNEGRQYSMPPREFFRQNPGVLLGLAPRKSYRALLT